MIKEQKRLEKKIVEKQQQIEAQGAETERLKKMNKVLNQQMANLQSKSKLMAMLEDRDMDTPSSEDSSPKSSFSTKTTKIEIKPRSLNSELLSPDSSSSDMSTSVSSSVSPSSSSVTIKPHLPNSITTSISTKSAGLVKSSANGIPNSSVSSSGLRITPTSSQHQVGENVTIGILTSSVPTSKRSPGLSLPISQDNLGSLGNAPDLLSPESSPKKPPVPSRAGVNRKLQKSTLPNSTQPPPPPPRSSSNKGSREDKTDSGRESDENLQNNTTKLCLNVNDPSFEYARGQIINSNTGGDGKSVVASGKGANKNILATSSPKRDSGIAISANARGHKNFESYHTQNDNNKSKSNRQQKTYIVTSNAEEKENKFSSGSDRGATDEGFSSSHEDQHSQHLSSLSPPLVSSSNSQTGGYNDYLTYAGLDTKSLTGSNTVSTLNTLSTTPTSTTALNNNTNTNNNSNTNSQIRTMTNHRAVQKPSDIKNRSKLKTSATSNLSVLEEHQVSGEGQVTTVTYWTEPYL